ncbi:MAG: alanine:cation symporter family protein [Cyanobacteria bacterium J06636_28]
MNFFSEENKTLFTGLRVVTLALIVWGASQDLGTIFGFADVTMGFLALVNLVALVLLFKVGLKVMRDFDQQIKSGVAQPVFDVRKFPELNLDPEAWILDEPAVPAMATASSETRMP